MVHLAVTQDELRLIHGSVDTAMRTLVQLQEHVSPKTSLLLDEEIRKYARLKTCLPDAPRERLT